MQHDCVRFLPNEDTWMAFTGRCIEEQKNVPTVIHLITSHTMDKKINNQEGRLSWTTEWVLFFMKAETNKKTKQKYVSCGFM